MVDDEHDLGGIASPGDRTYSGTAPLTGRLYERRLITVWNHGDAPDRWADEDRQVLRVEHTTDCYELYWAYRYRDSTLKQLTSFFLPLLCRRRALFVSPKILGTSPAARRAATVLSSLAAVAGLLTAASLLTGSPAVPVWILAGAVAVLGVAAVLVAMAAGILSTVRVSIAVVLVAAGVVATAVTAQSVGLAWLKGGAVGTVTAFAGSTLVVTLVRSLGDVARYLDTTPDSVEATNDLLASAVTLLEALHDDVNPDTGVHTYDRIVLVGHSLGSVIAYDALKQLWARRGTLLLLDADELAAVRALQRITAPALNGKASLDVVAYHGVRRRLVDLLSRPDRSEPGARWIVSDLVTLGSPLAHADALMAGSAADLAARITEGTIVTAPPRARRTPGSDPYLRLRAVRGTDRYSLPEAGMLAVVGWTNIYFQHDLVAGPVAGLFGPAVVDVRLGRSGWLARFLWPPQYPHSSYWTRARKPPMADLSRKSVERLRRILRRPASLVVTYAAGADPDDVDEALTEWTAGLDDDDAGPVDARILLLPTQDGPLLHWSAARQVSLDADDLARLRKHLQGLAEVYLFYS